MSKFNYSVFFDVETSIFNFDFKNSFLEYFLIETLPVENYARRSFEKFVRKYNRNLLKGASDRFLNQEYYKNFSGMPSKLLLEIGHSWYYKSKLEYGDNFFNPKSIFEIEMHKRNQAQIVLLSSSFPPCLEPLMEEFSFKFIICTELEVINGYYTGNILLDPVTIEGKSESIKNFLLKQDNKNLILEEKNSLLDIVNTQFCDISYDYKNDIMNYFLTERFKSLYRN